MTTKLWEACESLYFPRKLAITSDLTRSQYKTAIVQFGRHLGHAATLDDLTDDSLYSFLRHLQSRDLSPTTVNDRIGRIRTLWEWLARRQHVDRWPTVESVKESRRAPQAWTEEQLRQLFTAVEQEDRDVGRIAGELWWRAFLALAWTTSERISALLAVRWEWVEPETLYVPAEVRKGRTRDMVYPLWPETVATLDAIRRPERDLVLPWPYQLATLYNRFTRILKRAGLPHDRRCKAQRMRVSYATWVRAVSGRSAPNLGHASEETTRRHYEDPRICQAKSPKLFVPWD